VVVSVFQVACEQAPGGASAEETFGAKRRAIGAPIARRFAPNVCSALAPPGACSQAIFQGSSETF